MGGTESAGDGTRARALIGERAVYRALHWGYFNAKVLAVRPNGSVDIEVMAPAGHSMMFLSRIVLRPSRAECGKGEAYLGSVACGDC